MRDVWQAIPKDVTDKARAGAAFLMLIGSQAACTTGTQTTEQSPSTSSSFVQKGEFSSPVSTKEKPIPFDGETLAAGILNSTMEVQFFELSNPGEGTGPSDIEDLRAETNGLLRKNTFSIGGEAENILPQWARDRKYRGKGTFVMVVNEIGPDKDQGDKTRIHRKFVGASDNGNLKFIPDQVDKTNDADLIVALNADLSQIKEYSIAS